MSFRDRRKARIAAQAKADREAPAIDLLQFAMQCLEAIETYHTHQAILQRGNLHFRTTQCTSGSGGSHWNTVRLEPRDQPTKIVCVAPKDDVPKELLDWVIKELTKQKFKVGKRQDHRCCVTFEVFPRHLPE